MPTLKQKLFVHEYLRSGNATEAAIKAGYSKKTARSIASENLTKPDILQEIERITRRAEERVVIDKAYVIEALKEIVERCMEHKRILNNKAITGEDGIEYGIFRFNSRGALRALQTLGNHLNLFNNRRNINNSPQSMDDIATRMKEARERVRKLRVEVN